VVVPHRDLTILSVLGAILHGDTFCFCQVAHLYE
jgi:hypothetical protein